MSPFVRASRLAVVALLLAAVASAQDGDADAVKVRLADAKKAYDDDVQKFKKAVSDLFDKREEDARKVGNKKLVDAVKSERGAFDGTGDLPQTLPAAVRQPVATARTALDKAYQTAVKDYIRLKADAGADATEIERQQFLLASSFLVGKRTPVTTLKAFDISVWNNVFEANTAKYKLDKSPIPHSVFMHPNYKGSASVSYTLPAKVVAFRAVVGVPTHEDKQRDPHSPLTFEVLGDGRSLWKSDPVKKLDTFQTCTLKVEKVKKLTLQVHCELEHGGAHAVWFAPVVVE